MRLLTLLFLCLLAFSCKKEINERKPIYASSTVIEEKTIAEKIALAHGFENWKQVSKIEFTFNVQRDSSVFSRSWKWNPKNNNVIVTSKQDTISYNRASIDSTSINTDKGFINDKFWLLIPFQLVWDEGITISEPIKETAPISKTELHKITLTYGNKGGYTPGDAYDIFYNDDYLIKEWIFREGNSEEPSMITTFENYEDYKGIKIAKDHKMAKDGFNLFFSDIKIN